MSFCHLKFFLFKATFYHLTLNNYDCFLKLYSQGKEYILTPIDNGLGCKIQPSNNITENKNKRK